ncbi:MAG: hypothetical protein ABII01_02170 [Candidatus Woesearchaeota archaeon]
MEPEDDPKQIIISKLKRFTNHDIIKLTPKGDSAIFAAFYLAKKFYLDKDMHMTRKVVLIPDQGGWLSYKDLPGNLGFSIIEVKTRDGIIDTDDLNKKIDIHNPACFIYTNPAGYFADQPAEEIHDICKKKCLTIMDCSGSVGTSMCNGDYADMIVASFGRWKPINLKYGGFISIKNQDIYQKGSDVFQTIKFDEDYLPRLLEKIDQLPERYAFFEKHRRKILNDLKEFKIIYPKKKGINVIVKFSSEPEKNLIIKYCKDNNYEYTICPRYIRINQNAVSIEVKRLE